MHTCDWCTARTNEPLYPATMRTFQPKDCHTMVLKSINICSKCFRARTHSSPSQNPTLDKVGRTLYPVG